MAGAVDQLETAVRLAPDHADAHVNLQQFITFFFFFFLKSNNFSCRAWFEYVLLSADEWVPIRPGTEGVLALGIANVIMAAKAATPPPPPAAPAR